MGIEFDPAYVMIDASDANYNAIRSVLPEATILMCWFHVMKNVKQNCSKSLSIDKYETLKADPSKMHYSISEIKFKESILKFEDDWNKKGTINVYKYISTWLSGKFGKWQIFYNPPRLLFK